jgi:hypothetical protein
MERFKKIGRGIYRNARRFFKVFYSPFNRSCFPKKKFITSSYNKLIFKIINNKNLINQINKMRNKDVVQIKLERLEAEVKNIGYNIHKGDRDTAYAKVSEVLEAIGDIRTLLNTEHQD